MFPAGTVRIFRLRHGLTLAQVATRAGVSVRRLSTVERGLSLSRPGELQRIADSIEALASERRGVSQ